MTFNIVRQVSDILNVCSERLLNAPEQLCVYCMRELHSENAPTFAFIARCWYHVILENKWCICAILPCCAECVDDDQYPTLSYVINNILRNEVPCESVSVIMCMPNRADIFAFRTIMSIVIDKAREITMGGTDIVNDTILRVINNVADEWHKYRKPHQMSHISRAIILPELHDHLCHQFTTRCALFDSRIICDHIARRIADPIINDGFKQLLMRDIMPLTFECATLKESNHVCAIARFLI